MLHDLITILWKEAKSTLRVGGDLGKQLMAIAGPCLLAALLPIDYGAAWADSYISLILAIAIPIVLIGGLVPNSFAGEKERHTIETLLASRLSDKAIYLGKFAFIVSYGWVVTVACLLLSLVTVNLLVDSNGLLFYDPEIILAALGFSLIVSALVCSLGILISLLTDTVQLASQLLMGLMLVPPALVGAVALVLGFRPRVVLAVYAPGTLLLALGSFLLLSTLILFLLSIGLFKRSRLIS